MSDIKRSVRDWIAVAHKLPGAVSFYDWHALTHEEQAAIMEELRLSVDLADRPPQKRDDDAKTIAYLRREVADLNGRIDLLVNPDADR